MDSSRLGLFPVPAEHGARQPRADSSTDKNWPYCFPHHSGNHDKSYIVGKNRACTQTIANQWTFYVKTDTCFPATAKIPPVVLSASFAVQFFFLEPEGTISSKYFLVIISLFLKVARVVWHHAAVLVQDGAATLRFRDL